MIRKMLARFFSSIAKLLDPDTVIMSGKLYRYITTRELGEPRAVMIYHLLGVELPGYSKTQHPQTQRDIRRCIDFLREFPRASNRFRKMASVSPDWAVLVSEWARIDAATYDDLRNPIVGGPSRLIRLFNEILGSNE